ncbi:TPA: hypothetical protein ACWQC0_000476 [Escherichia coli]
MKQMSLIEMDGFLKGKCIPRDLKVNETNAEYLVRKFAELENKCAALVTENARLKSAVTQQIELRAEIKKAGRPPHADFWVQSICEAEEKVKRVLEETPATDAFLDEVRAQGVEMFADHLLCPDLDDTIRDFAAQLRKGVQS